MALNNQEKLKNFADEAINDAKKVSAEIEADTKREFQEKVEEGEKNILSQVYGYIQQEIDKIKKETSLKISQTDIKSKQDYFKYTDTVSVRVFNIVDEKLKNFMKSAEYGDYLFKSCKNVIEKAGTDIDIFYMPGDEEIMTNKVKSRLEEFLKDSGKSISGADFKRDGTIKSGGLRFFDRARNILINDVFEEKAERAKELLNSILGPQFTSVK